MTEAPRLKYRDEAIIVGAMLVLLGLVCNEFLLEDLLAPDGEWGAATRIKVRVFEAILLGTGVALLLLRNRFDSARDTLRAKLFHSSKLALLRSAMLLFILATLEVATMFLVAKRDAHLTASQD
ncbi:MAG: hypothetical protein IIB38_12030, partial [Candidatus Hydrogenedentes bacterium]|nr:hypothetical protein [Candidatus Hydrogenedentota bacterium]